MGGKGRGKGGPPPPPPAPQSAEARAEQQQQKRERTERERREALEAIARAKELEARKRDLESRLQALRCHDIASVPWDAALLGTHLCGGKGTDGLGGLLSGAGGVDVVELEGGTAVCVRNGPSIVTEIIADALAAALGVRVARMRLVLGGSEECRMITEASKRWRSEGIEREMDQIEKRLDTLDPEAATRLRAMLEPTTCAVLEFVPGLSLDAAAEALRDPSPALLAGLGHLCALDLLLNNMDRVPLPCWGSSGNLTNAIVTATGELVGIDQQVNRITPGPDLDAYLDKVRLLSAQVLHHGAPEAAQSIRTAITTHCGAELSDSSVARVIEGMAATLRRATVEAREGGLREALEAAAAQADEADASFGPAGHATVVGAGGAAAADVQFVLQVIGAVPEYPEGDWRAVLPFCCAR